LAQDLSVQLKNLLQFSNETNFTLIYQASKDGFGLKDFHLKCDNITNTLMIIQTTDSFILGGFTTLSWFRPINNNTDTYKYDDNAFIFSLTNALNGTNQTFKMNVNKPDSAVYTGSDQVENILSKVIGFGQSDLVLNDYSNVNINYAWFNEYLSYDLPALFQGNGSLIIDGDSFFTSQVEVFVVDACWSSPCMNGGSCHTVNFKYVCTCINSFTGDSCNRKLLDSVVFKNSNILTQEQSVSLLNILNLYPSTDFNLVYQATRDGFGLEDFHSKCDSILNTLMIIKTRDSYVFGGFTTKDWSQVSGFQADSNAFIFSLINPFNRPVKMNVINADNAIYQGPNLADYDYNEFIGFGENDILLNDYSNYQTSYAWSALSNFELPLFVNNNGSLLNGGKSNFVSSEIEVYSLVKKTTSIQVIQNAGECHSLVPCFIQPVIKIIDSNV